MIKYTLNNNLFIFRMAPEVIVCETTKDNPYDYKVLYNIYFIISLILSAKIAVHGLNKNLLF